MPTSLSFAKPSRARLHACSTEWGDDDPIRLPLYHASASISDGLDKVCPSEVVQTIDRPSSPKVRSRAQFYSIPSWSLSHDSAKSLPITRAQVRCASVNAGCVVSSLDSRRVRSVRDLTCSFGSSSFSGSTSHSLRPRASERTKERPSSADGSRVGSRMVPRISEGFIRR